MIHVYITIIKWVRQSYVRVLLIYLLYNSVCPVTHYVDLVALKLQRSNCLWFATPGAGTKGICHYAWLCLRNLIFPLSLFLYSPKREAGTWDKSSYLELTIAINTHNKKVWEESATRMKSLKINPEAITLLINTPVF